MDTRLRWWLEKYGYLIKIPLVLFLVWQIFLGALIHLLILENQNILMIELDDETKRSVVRQANALFVIENWKEYSPKDFLEANKKLYALEQEYQYPLRTEAMACGSFTRASSQMIDNIRTQRVILGEIELKDYQDQMTDLNKKFEQAPWYYEPLRNWQPTWQGFLRYLVKVYFCFFGAAIIFYLMRSIEMGFDFKKEFRYCPWRLLRAIFLCPQYIWSYPRFAESAEWVRYNKAKARLLRGKSFGYRPSDFEEAILREIAAKPVIDLDAFIESLKINEGMVKKSLTVAYISLLLSVIYSQLAIPLPYKQQADNSSVQTICFCEETQHKARDCISRIPMSANQKMSNLSQTLTAALTSIVLVALPQFFCRLSTWESSAKPAKQPQKIKHPPRIIDLTNKFICQINFNILTFLRRMSNEQEIFCWVNNRVTANCGS